MALLLSYQAWLEIWHPHPVLPRGFPVESRMCFCYTMRASERSEVGWEKAEHQGLAPRTPLGWDSGFQDRFLDWPDVLQSISAMTNCGSPAWTRTMTNRLTGGHAPLTSQES